MQFDVITIFPHILDSYFSESIIKRAVEDGKIAINVHNLRDWTTDSHKTVDDTPYGGGAGMVMKVEPVFKAVMEIKEKNPQEKIRVAVLSANGRVFDQKKAYACLEYDRIILICGRYEGVDQRIIVQIADEEISIGKYVLTGGELPAAVVIDCVTRLIPGVLGNEASLTDESFSSGNEGEYPQYTRPEDFRGWKVPEVLLSGDHKKIQEWKEKNKRLYGKQTS